MVDISVSSSTIFNTYISIARVLYNELDQIVISISGDFESLTSDLLETLEYKTATGIWNIYLLLSRIITYATQRLFFIKVPSIWS